MRVSDFITWLARVSMYALILAACYQQARADTTWRVHCGEHLSSGHHLDSYIAYWDLEIVYPTEAACGAGADNWLAHHYHGGIMDDGRRVLVQCWCERVKP